MKNLKYLFLIITVFLISCNNHEEVVNPQSFPIQYEFEPEYKIFNAADLTSEELSEMPDENFVINSEEDFPEKNLMGTETIKESNIDFQKYTLLLSYKKLPGIIMAHRYTWSKNLQENKFNFYMQFFTDDEEIEKPIDIFTYYRSAVLVNKLPLNSNVEFSLSITYL